MHYLRSLFLGIRTEDLTTEEYAFAKLVLKAARANGYGRTSETYRRGVSLLLTNFRRGSIKVDYDDLIDCFNPASKNTQFRLSRDGRKYTGKASIGIPFQFGGATFIKDIMKAHEVSAEEIYHVKMTGHLIEAFDSSARLCLRFYIEPRLVVYVSNPRVDNDYVSENTLAEFQGYLSILGIDLNADDVEKHACDLDDNIAEIVFERSEDGWSGPYPQRVRVRS